MLPKRRRRYSYRFLSLGKARDRTDRFEMAGGRVITSAAPSAPSSLVAHGPTAAIVRSNTRMPSRIFATIFP